MLPRRHVVAFVSVYALVACSPDKAAAPTPACTASTPLTLGVLEGGVVGSPPCAQLSSASGKYLAIAQYPVQGSTPQQTAFKMTAGTGSASASIVEEAWPVNAKLTGMEGTSMPRQMEFDARLRDLERDIPLSQFVRGSGPKLSMTRSASTPPDSLHDFQVLTTTAGGQFVTTQARLRYEGQHVYIYEDTGVVNSGAFNSFSDSEYTAFGKMFDDVLYPIDTAAFGSPSDQDTNGHIILLITQQVNKLTPAADCPTKGFVAGYFYGYDLSTGANSNRGEIFYSVAPDTLGVYSCKHTKPGIRRLTPATFIHEFQHMISYNQHVLVRGTPSEVTWLNEGLSHIAEELGGRHYEAKYPAPLGRTDPTQLLPDSAQDFVRPQFVNAYSYLLAPTTQSVTTFSGLGTLEERGAAWLFLRWLGDQKGEGIYRQLVQTNRTGIDNVADKAGEPFPALFGDFGIATYADSIDGVPRSSIPIRYRFTSRNTRQIFARLFPFKPNPITPSALACNTSVNGSMLQGTSSYLLLGGTAGCSSAQLSLSASNGIALAAALSARIAIFRLP
jgi:hypothetical protein